MALGVEQSRHLRICLCLVGLLANILVTHSPRNHKVFPFKSLRLRAFVIKKHVNLLFFEKTTFV